MIFMVVNGMLVTRQGNQGKLRTSERQAGSNWMFGLIRFFSEVGKPLRVAA